MHARIILPVFPFDLYQKNYYFQGYRNIWQADSACAELDDTLIYRPRIGACKFINPEFNTVLNFDAAGRIVPARNLVKDSLKGIAILGDSYAMGWGVSDWDSFANKLQEKISVPVFNLGVKEWRKRCIRPTLFTC